MARTRSAKVEEILEKLRTRLREGVYRPGDRFLSARELAANFGVSYQTAHRLLDELHAEGLVERRAASGTYVPGGQTVFSEVRLLFNARARRPDSFGARLLAGLTHRLKRDGLTWELNWDDAPVEIAPDSFPVLWESPAAMAVCLRERRTALLLNQRPPPGLDAAFLDSVSMNDFFGGVCAAQLLLRGLPATARIATVTGPDLDVRSCARRDGFLSLAKRAAVISAGSWYFEDGLRVANQALIAGQDGIFCGNDRLAEAVLACCQTQRLPIPRLVGFDDAPIAERLNLTTIAIPWEEMIADAVDTIRRRLSGDISAARQLIVTPRPVIRRL